MGEKQQQRKGAKRETREMKYCDTLAYLTVFALSLAVYYNSLDGDFVHDDLSAVTTNSDVINLASYWDLFGNDFWGTPLSDALSHKSYRPLTVLTFRWNYVTGGMDPQGFHLVNVALHGCVTVLLAFVCYHALCLSLLTAALTAALFALHPIHTEAVSGIVGRADILATLFFLLTFYYYNKEIQYQGDHNVAYLGHHWWASAIFSLASCASKEHGISALPTALLWDILRNGRSFIRSRMSSLPDSPMNLTADVIVSKSKILLTVAWRLVLLRGNLPVFSAQDNPAAFCADQQTRILSLLYLPAFNFGLLLYPCNLSYDWQTSSIPLITGFLDPRNLATLTFYTTLSLAAVLAVSQRKKVLLWSLLVMVVPMLPASNLFYPVGFVVAERLLYLPSMGFCLLTASGLEAILHKRKPQDSLVCRSESLRCQHSKWRRKIASVTPTATCLKSLMAVSILIVSVSFILKVVQRNGDWASRRTLFTSGLKTLPNNAKVHYNYANLQKDESNYTLAIQHYRTAIKLWPNYSSAHNNLGTVLLSQVDNQLSGAEKDNWIAEAEHHFLLAIAAHPRHANAHYNLAVVSILRNERQSALNLLRRCLRINPAHREGRRLLDAMTTAAQTPFSYQRKPEEDLQLKDIIGWRRQLNLTDWHNNSFK